jgi:hypothetical protein
MLMKYIRMCTVCPVRSGLRHCERIIAKYVHKYVCIYVYMLFRKDVVALKVMGKGKGEF